MRKGFTRAYPSLLFGFSAWLLSQTGGAAPLPSTPEALPPPQTCTPETVDLTEAGGPLAGEKGLVQDQDGLGVCYANTGSLLLNAITPPHSEPVSFLDLSLNHSDLQASSPFAKLVIQDSKTGQDELSIEGGLTCDVVNEALEKGYVCPRSAVPLENHAFNQQSRWGQYDTAGSDAQKSLLLSYGKVIDALRAAPDSVKTRWSEKANFASLIQSSADYTRCDQSNVSSHNMEEFILLAVQKVILDQSQNEERIEEIQSEIQLSEWGTKRIQAQKKEVEQRSQKIDEELRQILKSESSLTDQQIQKKTSGLSGVFKGKETVARIQELQGARKKAQLETQQLEQIIQDSEAEVKKLQLESEKLSQDVAARQTFIKLHTETINEFGQLKLKEEISDRVSKSGAYESALYSQAAALSKIRNTHKGATPAIKIGDTPLAPPLTTFLTETVGLKPEWVDLQALPIPLSTFADDLRSTDPEVCARNALADLLMMNEGVIKSCTQSSSPAEEKAVLALTDAFNELGLALSSSDIPAEDFARALTGSMNQQDFERTLQALLSPHCHSGKDRISFPANSPRCVQENFPPASIGYPSGPPKTPRTAGQLDPIRPFFRSQVYDHLKGRSPVGLDLCSASFSNPKVDRGNIHCTQGLHGFHAVTAVGYRIHTNCKVEYLIQNSWGSSNCPLPQIPSNDPNAPGMIPNPQCSGGKFWLGEDILLRNTFHTNVLEQQR